MGSLSVGGIVVTSFPILSGDCSLFSSICVRNRLARLRLPPRVLRRRRPAVAEGSKPKVYLGSVVGDW